GGGVSPAACLPCDGREADVSEDREAQDRCVPVRLIHRPPTAIVVLQRDDESDEAGVDPPALTRQAKKRGGLEIDVMEHGRVFVDYRGDGPVHLFLETVR